MSPDARDYLRAARVPAALQPQEWGLWRIDRLKAPADELCPMLGIHPIGFPDYTILYRTTVATLHHELGEVVMEDSQYELRQHLPIWMAAQGHVLVTGLGLGCVVRGLMANPNVERIDVVELDGELARRVWPSVESAPRAWGWAGPEVHLHVGDAFDFIRASKQRWDFAWHDLWIEEHGLAVKHMELVTSLQERVQRQGCWGFDRRTRLLFRHKGLQLLGTPRAKRGRRERRSLAQRSVGVDPHSPGRPPGRLSDPPRVDARGDPRGAGAAVTDAKSR